MSVEHRSRRRWSGLVVSTAVLAAVISMPAQQMVTETRDPAQPQDEEFAKAVAEWTTQPYYTSPLVDHLPKVDGIPSPKDVLGYHVGAPAKLTYYADILKYYRALAAATPRVKVETIGKSDEDRELVVVWVSSDENMQNLQVNRDNLAKIADPRGLPPERIRQLIATSRPHYHLMGGLHSGETGPSEMLMELVYRLATETSPLIRQIRENVVVSVTPAADADGRDRYLDWFYRGLETAAQAPSAAAPSAAALPPRRRRRRAASPRPRRPRPRRPRPVRPRLKAAAAAQAGRACRTGGSTSITTTTATSTSRRCPCGRSPIGTSRRTRRSCTTCTSRSR